MNQSHCMICSISSTDTSVNLYSLSGRLARKHTFTFYVTLTRGEEELSWRRVLQFEVNGLFSLEPLGWLFTRLQRFMHLSQNVGVHLHGPLYSGYEPDPGFDQIQDMVSQHDPPFSILNVENPPFCNLFTADFLQISHCIGRICNMNE